MLHFFLHSNLSRFILPAVLPVFAITYNAPAHCAQFQIGFQEICFFARIEKSINDLLASEQKSSSHMIDAVVSIKHEIENNYNIKFNTDYYFDQMAKEVQKSGSKIGKKELSKVKSLFKKRDSLLRHKALCDQYDMPWQEYAHKNDNDDIEIPALLVYGVTCCLCGLFLMVLPVPVAKDWGARMVVAGVTACANSLCAKADEKK